MRLLHLTRRLNRCPGWGVRLPAGSLAFSSLSGRSAVRVCVGLRFHGYILFLPAQARVGWRWLSAGWVVILCGVEDELVLLLLTSHDCGPRLGAWLCRWWSCSRLGDRRRRIEGGRRRVEDGGEGGRWVEDGGRDGDGERSRPLAFGMRVDSLGGAPYPVLSWCEGRVVAGVARQRLLRVERCRPGIQGETGNRSHRS